MKAWVFHDKFEENDMGALCSREDGLFFRQNMGITTGLFFNGGFLQNIGMKVMIFLETSETKGILWTFWFII